MYLGMPYTEGGVQITLVGLYIEPTIIVFIILVAQRLSPEKILGERVTSREMTLSLIALVQARRTI